MSKNTFLVIGAPEAPDPMALMEGATEERDVIVEVMVERMSGVPEAILLEVELKQRLAVSVAWNYCLKKGQGGVVSGRVSENREMEEDPWLIETYHSRHLASAQGGNGLHGLCIGSDDDEGFRNWTRELRNLFDA